MSEDRHIRLAHGNGGRFMRSLIEEVFARRLGNPDLDVSRDASPFALGQGVPYVTTDGFSVQPLEFPGGTIGSLAVNGTVNDLAVAGAKPLYLTLAAIIEEGLELAQLERIVDSLAEAAQHAGVRVLAGDTKVVPRGHGGGLYLVTTGIGLRPAGPALGLERIRAGDRLLVSGPVGDHGAAVMVARQDFDLRGKLESDCASVVPLTEAAMGLDGLRFMRDPTRGGIATVAHEIVAATTLGVRLYEDTLPIREPVRSVCEILGLDPCYLASEGRVAAVASADAAPLILKRWQALGGGREAAIIGEIIEGRPRVVMRTLAGGERMIEELEDDPMPRIC